MHERVWYRSLYWRIAVGYIALLAVLLVVQTGLAVWLTDRMWGRSSRTPGELAEIVAQDVSERLAQSPGLDLATHLRDTYGSGYQPFVLVLTRDERTLSNRPTAVPPTLGREARGRLKAAERRPGDRDAGDRWRLPGERGRGGDRGRTNADFAEVTVAGALKGLVAVPQSRPPLSVGLRELAPTLVWVAVAMLGAGAGLMALLIFGPIHRRLHSLQEAARAVGEGRTDVRADASGGDEVSALSAAFNHMAADLEARAAALAEADRVRRQLLADVSHELMTPLSAIRGYVETLGMKELQLDAPTRDKYLDIAHQETHKLEAIIGDLLDLARLEGGGDSFEPDEVLVDDLLRRVADRHRPATIGRRVTLATSAASGTPLIWGDADRLEQALQNVAANAIRHTPDGGTVTLRAEPAGEHVRLTVTDSGPGILAEHLPHVFDRFYKADASRAGTGVESGSGLGLSIVRAIVARHGGEVSAANAPGGGAVFTLMIPAAGRSARHGG